MRITVLAYVETEGDKPDVVVEHVVGALRSSGHDVSALCVHADVNRLIAGLRRRQPDLVFNLAEMFGDDWFGDIPLAGLLGLLGLRYTGGGPGEFYLGGDKVLAKKLLAQEGVPSPRYAVFTRDSVPEISSRLRMPLFVKPARMDASLGIDRRCVVYDTRALMRRVVSIQDTFDDAAMAEEYIDGREFFVGVLGNVEPVALPPIEVDFSGLPAGAPRVLSRKAKFETTSTEYQGTRSVVADIPDELRERLQLISINAYRALRVRDYGRVDLRVTESGDIYVLEVNPSCYLERTSEFATAAQAAGIDYPTLVQRIVDLAVERHGRGSVQRRLCFTASPILHLIDGAAQRSKTAGRRVARG